MQQITIMGLGLMGGSLGLALKKRGFEGRINVYARRQATRDTALEMGLCDAVFDDPVEAVREADLVIYCTPILTIPALVEASKAGLKAGAILTDVGSTKAELAEQIEPILAGSGATFVGSHPVAGSEQTGVEAARPDLYEDALVVVTPSDTDKEAAAVEQVVQFWTGLGAIVEVISATKHDQLMARTSHLPHLVASLLAVTAGRDDVDGVGPYCGTGFRDTSRVAGGSPEVWHDIVSTNTQAIGVELAAYRDQLDQLIGWCEANDFDRIKEFLAHGRDCRRALMERSPAE